MIMKIFLARHGQTDWNLNNKIQGWTDVPLNKLGLEQAARLGEELKGVEFGQVYSSPLRRATETAEVALETARAFRGEIELMDELKERGFGEFEGRAGETYDARKYWDLGLNSSEGGVEPIKALFERLERAKARILSENEAGATVLVVAHGASLKALYYSLVGYEAGKTNFREFHLENGEVKAVEI